MTHKTGNGTDYLLLAKTHLTGGLAQIEGQHPDFSKCAANAGQFHMGSAELLRGLAYDRMAEIDAKLLARQTGEEPVIPTGRSKIFPLGSFKLGNLMNAQGIVGVLCLSMLSILAVLAVRYMYEVKVAVHEVVELKAQVAQIVQGKP